MFLYLFPNAIPMMCRLTPVVPVKTKWDKYNEHSS